MLFRTIAKPFGSSLNLRVRISDWARRWQPSATRGPQFRTFKKLRPARTQQRASGRQGYSGSWGMHRRSAGALIMNSECIVQSGRLGKITSAHVELGQQHSRRIGNPPDAEPPAGLDWDLRLGPAQRLRALALADWPDPLIRILGRLSAYPTQIGALHGTEAGNEARTRRPRLRNHRRSGDRTLARQLPL